MYRSKWIGRTLQVLLKIALSRECEIHEDHIGNPYGALKRSLMVRRTHAGLGRRFHGTSRANDTPSWLERAQRLCKYSVDVTVRDIGLTVHAQSPIYAHTFPVEPDPDQDYAFIDQASSTYNYSLFPHQVVGRSAPLPV
jgi:hypothetical protein